MKPMWWFLYSGIAYGWGERPPLGKNIFPLTYCNLL